MAKWLTGLEALLEKVDQTAASSLHGDSSLARRPGSPSFSTGRSTQGSGTVGNSDDKLFEFLNDSSGTLQLDVDSATHNKPAGSEARIPSFSAGSFQNKPANFPDSGSSAKCSELRDNPPVTGSHGDENRYLKEEITSLQRELHEWAERYRLAQNELSGLRDQSSQLKVETGCIELVLKAREKELAEVRSQLKEAENRIAEGAGTSTECNRHDNDASSHQQAEGQQSLMTELTAQLQTKEEELNAAQVEIKELNTQLHRQKEEQRDASLSFQQQLGEERLAATRTAHSLASAQKELENSQRELHEYKERAARILQAKEQLLNHLRSGANSEESTSAEIVSLKQERDIVLHEVASVKQQLRERQLEMEELEAAHLEELQSLQDERLALESQLIANEQQHKAAESSLEQRLKEMEGLHASLLAQKVAWHSSLQESQGEVQILREKLNDVQRNASISANENELEARVHSLTDSLLAKQTLVETLSSEKSSLLLQLEKAKQSAAQVKMQMKQTDQPAVLHSIGLGIPDHDQLQSMAFMRSDSSGFHSNQLVRHVRTAANTLDRFSIRLGIFLRRYPAARLMVIVYMVFLHLWVMVVLLTYKPEIHQDNGQPF